MTKKCKIYDFVEAWEVREALKESIKKRIAQEELENLFDVLGISGEFDEIVFDDEETDDE